MATRHDRPRLAVIVANGITGDSRVQKTALAAARAGWEVFLIGSTPDKKSQRSYMGPVTVIRVPVPPHMRQHTRAHPVRRLITQFGISDRAALARVRAAHQGWVRRTTARMGWLRVAEARPGPARPIRRALRRVLGAWVRGRRALFNLRRRAFGWEQSRRRQPTGNWARDMPHLVDLDLAFGPVIEELEPDLIHANDITMIGTAAYSAARMRLSGRKVAWVYDAHEYVRAVEWPRPDMAKAYPALEAEFIGRADAVITVSPEIAERIQGDYRLPERPLVVRNTPIRQTVGTMRSEVSVRAACKLDEGTPLLVYSGWISAERGLGSAVGALPHLPDAHLAIVCGRTSPELERLLARADELDVRDRVHVVPYVASHAVPDYLSSADVGVICSQRTLNYELSMPTKLSEYIHGGLPVVVSDVKVLSEYVRRHGFGEVFQADDPVSFAAAARRALDNRAALAERISEEALDELSWERQAEGLLRLYRKVSPVAPEPAEPSGSWSLEERALPVVVAGPVQARELGDWRPLGDTPVRLGLGPANYAGQGAAFAKAICRDNPKVSAEVVMLRQRVSFDYPADVYIDSARLGDMETQLEQLRRIIGRYTHVLVDAFLPVFGHLTGDSVEHDLPLLRQAGVTVALLGHGSDIRHPGRHMARYEFSMFRDAPEGMVAKLTAKAERNRRIAAEAGVPLFVTTPDLLDDLPQATWTPLVVDVDAWVSDHPVMDRKRPVVLHVPPKRWTKGTDRILPALRRLHDKGRIELTLAEHLRWAQVRELIRTADVVLDQFTSGSFGTLAVEAMAAGRPVVGFVAEHVGQAVGADLPIVSAPPAQVGAAVESLIDDPARAVAVGAASAAYARKYHDGTVTARVLAEFLQ